MFWPGLVMRAVASAPLVGTSVRSACGSHQEKAGLAATVIEMNTFVII